MHKTRRGADGTMIGDSDDASDVAFQEPHHCALGVVIPWRMALCRGSQFTCCLLAYMYMLSNMLPGDRVNRLTKSILSFEVSDTFCQVPRKSHSADLFPPMTASGLGGLQPLVYEKK